MRDDAPITGTSATSRGKRVTAPIKRLHADGSVCTHKISPSGKPRPGEDCPGPAEYTSACSGPGCHWSVSGSIRAYVEEQRSSHVGPPHQAVPGGGEGGESG